MIYWFVMGTLTEVKAAHSRYAKFRVNLWVTLAISLHPQAWASHPLGVWGKLPSRISGTKPAAPVRINGSELPSQARAAGIPGGPNAAAQASQNSGNCHVQAVPL